MVTPIWIVRKTDDAFKPLAASKIVFSKREDADSYVAVILGGYGIVYSIPMHTDPVTMTREQLAEYHIVKNDLV
jgi:predicted peptidase